MRCPHCAFENREGVRFCEDCGRGLEQVCPACAAAVPPGRKFCGTCGQSLPSGRPVARATAPEAYTPKHLAEKILTSRSALEGERKQVTVLFADLKGSMELLADRDHEEARKLLDPVLERMMEAVHRYEGTVNQVMGDGIMALFGAPIAHEDHAVRACYAALDLQRAMRRLTEGLRRSHGVTVEVRVGLNSGEVVVRAISNDLHLDYTAVGQTTHLAARMEQLASPGTTLLTADTLRLAEGYVEESVRSLVDDGVLAGERGAYRLVKTPETVHVPATVQAILAARIDRVPAVDKDLLQTAAVVGTDVPVAVLAAVAEISGDTLAGGLARLQAAEFLYETSLFPDAEYTFKHALTHEVAYGSLLQDRRHALHARVVTAIERLYPERLAEHVERLAQHALRGEAWAKAVLYLRQAGGKAMERSAHVDAVACFDQALDALQHLPESRERTEQAIDLHLDASGALFATGGLAKTSTDYAHEAEALAERLGDERRLGRALAELADRAWNAGDSDRALELGQRALAIAIEHDDVSLPASVNVRLGLVWQVRGDYRRAAEHLSQCAEALQGDRLHERFSTGTLTSVFARERLAWCLAELGEFAEAMARAEEAVRIAREVDHPGSLVLARRSLGLVSLRRGDLTQAIPPLERAVELCRVIPVRRLFDVAAAHLGYAYAMSGRLPEGVVFMEEALADPPVTGTANHPLFLAYLGEAHLLAGRRDDALTVARRALDLAHRQKERGNEAWVLRLLGEIAAQADPPDLESAEAHYARALSRADELGMRPLVAHCHLGLGTLYRRTGDRPKADEHLTMAVRLYREMDMAFWREKAEAALSAIR